MLVEGKSKEALKKNIKAEIESGKPPKQAVAIAYSKQKSSDSDKNKLKIICESIILISKEIDKINNKLSGMKEK
jgi:hypothetical protein